jgi:hypothetical protein
VKGPHGAVGLGGLHDADAELAGLGCAIRRVARLALGPVEQLPEGIDLGEGEVVSRDEAQAGSRAQGSEDPRLELIEAAAGDEGGDDGDLGGVREQRPELGAQGIVVAAGGEWGSAVADGGGRLRFGALLDRMVSGAGVLSSSGDDVEGRLGNGFAPDLARRDADLVGL